MIKRIVFTLIFFLSACHAEDAKGLQRQADILREEGKTLEALNLYNRALVAYEQQHDYKGLLTVLTGRLISWQHLYNHGEEKVYAILARKEAEAMEAIANEYGVHDRDDQIHFFLGKTAIFLKEYPTAEKEFKKALELYPYDNAERGDWLAHLGEALYRNGRKESGEQTILEGVRQIEAHPEEDTFKAHVWISGAYLRLAKLLISDNRKEEAKPYLQKGEEIISGDPRLVIRKQQLQKLRGTL